MGDKEERLRRLRTRAIPYEADDEDASLQRQETTDDGNCTAGNIIYTRRIAK